MGLEQFLKQYHKLIAYFIGIVLFAQILYIPSGVGFEHIVLFVLTLVILDLVDKDKLKGSTLLSLYSSYLLVPIILLISRFIIDIRYLYYVALMLICACNLYVIFLIRKDVKEKTFGLINGENQRFASKKFFAFFYNTSGIIVILIVIQSILKLLSL